METVGWGAVRVGSVLWQPAEGSFALTVVAKTTFVLEPGESPLDEEPEDIYAADTYWDDDPERSLAQATDLVPGKAQPEVLVVGSAYAPGRAPAGSLCARISIGEVDKSIRVCGDRWFGADGVLSEPRPFMRMPLTWERAVGGPDTDNPAGMESGPTARMDGWGRAPAPNLESLDAPITDRFHGSAPVSFGPIAPGWRPRASRLFLYGSPWDPSRWNEAPLPSGVDFAFWNVAPRDQRMTALRVDQPLLLENLDSRHPRLTTRLAHVHVTAAIERAGEAARSLQLAPDTLTIDTDRGLAMLVFRGLTLLDHPRRPGRVIVQASRAETAPATAAEPMPAASARAPAINLNTTRQPLAAPGAAGSDAGETLTGVLLPVHHPTLPFAGLVERAGPEGGPAAATLYMAPPSAPSSPLPFRESSAEETMFGGLEPVAPALPFANDAGARELAPREIPFHVPRPAAVEQDEMSDGVTISPPAVIVEQDGMSEAETVPPPPMIGPLATPEMERRSPEKRGGAVVAEPAFPPARAVVEDVEPAPLPIEDIPLARCAALDASIALRPGETAEILEAARLDAPMWRRVKAHHADAIRAETRRGKTGLLTAYDRAYVAQLENERGAISVTEYAKIAVAAERGEAPEGLALPADGLLRVRRSWISKMAMDPATDASVRVEMERARAD